MARKKSKMGNDLERIRTRLLASKKSLHESELKAENLEASIQTAMRDQEKLKEKQK